MACPDCHGDHGTVDICPEGHRIGVRMNDKPYCIPCGRNYLDGEVEVPVRCLRKPEESAVKVRPIFAWYDFWIGGFWDRAKRRLYIFPLPFIGFFIQFKTKQ